MGAGAGTERVCQGQHRHLVAFGVQRSAHQTVPASPVHAPRTSRHPPAAPCSAPLQPPLPTPTWRRCPASRACMSCQTRRLSRQGGGLSLLTVLTPRQKAAHCRLPSRQFLIRRGWRRAHSSLALPHSRLLSSLQPFRQAVGARVRRAPRHSDAPTCPPDSTAATTATSLCFSVPVSCGCPAGLQRGWRRVRAAGGGAAGVARPHAASGARPTGAEHMVMACGGADTGGGGGGGGGRGGVAGGGGGAGGRRPPPRPRRRSVSGVWGCACWRLRPPTGPQG